MYISNKCSFLVNDAADLTAEYFHLEDSIRTVSARTLKHYMLLSFKDWTLQVQYTYLHLYTILIKCLFLPTVLIPPDHYLDWMQWAMKKDPCCFHLTCTDRNGKQGWTILSEGQKRLHSQCLSSPSLTTLVPAGLSIQLTALQIRGLEEVFFRG